MGILDNAVKAIEQAIKGKNEADAAAAVKAKQVAAQKAINDEAARPIAVGRRYTPVTEKETEIRGNLAGFKKGGSVSSSARGQGAVIRKKKSARIC